MNVDKLIEHAKQAMNYSYSPYSKFKVGAALETTSGQIFTGCNIENISYSLSICAERVAIFKAVSEGYKSFNAIAVVSSEGKPVYPCGACRQVLAEYNNDIKIYVDKPIKQFSIEEMLPHSFEFNYSKNA